jgi:hypothetical protein
MLVDPEPAQRRASQETAPVQAPKNGNGLLNKILVGLVILAGGGVVTALIAWGGISKDVVTHGDAIKTIQVIQLTDGRKISEHDVKIANQEKWMERIEMKLDKALAGKHR